jgi:putative oxidoreductase
MIARRASRWGEAMSFSEQISPLLGRWVLAWFFLSEAWARAANWDATLTLMGMSHISYAPPLLAIALMVMVLGGLSLLLGFQTRHGAMLLFAYTIVVTVMMHAYWTIDDAVARASDYEIFARNLAIAGGLLLLVGMGPGRFGIDNRGQKKR